MCRILHRLGVIRTPRIRNRMQWVSAAPFLKRNEATRTNSFVSAQFEIASETRTTTVQSAWNRYLCVCVERSLMLFLCVDTNYVSCITILFCRWRLIAVSDEACFEAVYGSVARARARPGSLGLCGVCRRDMKLGDPAEHGKNSTLHMILMRLDHILMSTCSRIRNAFWSTWDKEQLADGLAQGSLD